jgi:hypothetical protein
MWLLDRHHENKSLYRHVDIACYYVIAFEVFTVVTIKLKSKAMPVRGQAHRCVSCEVRTSSTYKKGKAIPVKGCDGL